jgi:hypothetical protein
MAASATTIRRPVPHTTQASNQAGIARSARDLSGGRRHQFDPGNKFIAPTGLLPDFLHAGYNVIRTLASSRPTRMSN